MSVLKPGVKTSEFILAALAQVIGDLLATGQLADGLVPQILGAAMAVLSFFGYVASRTMVKRSALESGAPPSA